MNEFNKPELNELVHYGVKGMKWGVRKRRKDESPQERIKKLQKEIDKYDGQQIFDGYSYIGWEAKKFNKKNMKKNPNFQEDYKKLPQEVRDADRQKLANRAMRRTLTSAAIQSAILVGGGGYAVSKVKVNAEAKRGAQAALVVMATQHLALVSVKQTMAIRAAQVHYTNRNAISAIERELRTEKSAKGGRK